MRAWIRHQFDLRPWWMNAIMLFSIYMAFVYVPWDLFIKPVSKDVEVWFGIMFHGWAAKLLAVPHWIVYGVLAYGFWRMRPWTKLWSSIYVGQVAIGMFVWPIAAWGGVPGLLAGVVSGGLFGALTWALWSSDAFRPATETLRERYGGWALVTGASAGIGLEFARAFARAGLPVVLTARREENLKRLASELEQNHGVETRVVAVDLGAPDGPDRLVAAVADLDVGILVNNAGFGYSGRFSSLDAERLNSMIQLNCVAPVIVTSKLLPRLRERGRGAIIVTSSIAGNQILPYHGVYSATKGFDTLFGGALWAELLEEGIDALALEPGSTVSEFHDRAGELPHPGEPAADVVETALEALGKQPVVVSGWLNWLRGSAARRLLPQSWVALIAGDVAKANTPEDMR